MGFGMLVAGTSVNALQVYFVALVVLCITSLDGTTKQETLFTHPGRHDLRQRRREKAVKLRLCNYTSGSSRYLQLLHVNNSKSQARWLTPVYDDVMARRMFDFG